MQTFEQLFISEEEDYGSSYKSLPPSTSLYIFPDSHILLL